MHPIDVDKLKKWLDVAQQFQGKDFWSDIFDETEQPPFTKTNEKGQQNMSVPQRSPAPQPATDLFQTPLNWVVVIDLPGMEKSDIQLSCARNTLTVKGKVPELFPDAEIVHSERLSGQFERTINLPENIDGIKPSAQFKTGCLIIQIPRRKTQAFQIDIE